VPIRDGSSVGCFDAGLACHVTPVMPTPTHIAILGGGLTGLSSAFHLSRRFPKSLVTLVEKQPRLGGWIRSERIRVPSHDGTEILVLLEGGPRTLRPNAKSILELVSLPAPILSTTE